MKLGIAASLIAIFVVPQAAPHEELILSNVDVIKTFDQTKPTNIRGVIKKVEWVNPHAWITAEIKNANSSRTNWHVELASAAALRRRGIRPEDLALQKSCSVEDWPSRDGTKTAYGRKLTLAGGRSFEVGNRFFEDLPASQSRQMK